MAILSKTIVSEVLPNWQYFRNNVFESIAQMEILVHTVVSEVVAKLATLPLTVGSKVARLGSISGMTRENKCHD